MMVAMLNSSLLPLEEIMATGTFQGRFPKNHPDRDVDREGGGHSREVHLLLITLPLGTLIHLKLQLSCWALPGPPTLAPVPSSQKLPLPALPPWKTCWPDSFC